jgi:release factor glutamine methyltransferase
MKIISDGQRVLEIGTGPLALLSIFVAKHKNTRVTSTDIDSEILEHAARSARLNGVTLNLVESDLLSNIGGRWETVFFNPPYVPKGHVLSPRGTGGRISAWEGGKSGLDVVLRFLNQAWDQIDRDTKILIGINTLYVSEGCLKAAAEELGYQIERVHSPRMLPSRIYRLVRGDPVPVLPSDEVITHGEPV